MFAAFKYHAVDYLYEVSVSMFYMSWHQGNVMGIEHNRTRLMFIFEKHCIVENLDWLPFWKLLVMRNISYPLQSLNQMLFVIIINNENQFLVAGVRRTVAVFESIFHMHIILLILIILLIPMKASHLNKKICHESSLELKLYIRSQTFGTPILWCLH